MNLDYILKRLVDLLMEYGPRVLLVIVVLFVGVRLIRWIVKVTGKGLEKRLDDPSLGKFINSVLSWVLRLMLFLSVAGMIGVETTSFVAILGAAGLAIGLALQGALANLAGGVLIMIFRPFKINDLIHTQGELGVVQEIQIFTTVLLTPDNKTVIVPNGPLIGGNITNYSADGKIRIDLIIGISYDSDIRKAREVLVKEMQKDDLVLKDPAPTVEVSELADSSVNLAVRPWAHPDHYWDVYFATLENAKYALNEANITIPYPQMDVHLAKAED